MKTQLELFLITYNRREKCRQTLQAVLAENSPLKTLPLTILDNCSTDGTSEMLAEIAEEHSNIRFIRHEKNIGGNANIARAFEMASAPYVWVLCDDDKLDFSNWPECENLLAQNPAAVVVANYSHPQKGPEYLFRQLSFVPAAIYRTDLITSTVLINMHFNVANMFPQLAVAAAAINSKHPIPILSKPLVHMQLNPGNDSYIRGTQPSTRLYPVSQQMNWMMGYLVSVGLLNNARLRTRCCFLAQSEEECFYNYCGRFMEKGTGLFYTYAYGVHFHTGLAKTAFMLLAPFAYICSFFTDEKGINIRLFGRIKIRIWKFSKPKNN